MRFLKGLLLFIFTIIAILVLGISIAYIFIDFDQLLELEKNNDWLLINILLFFLPILFLYLIKVLGWFPLALGNIICILISLCFRRSPSKVARFITKLIILLSLIVLVVVIIVGIKRTNEIESAFTLLIR